MLSENDQENVKSTPDLKKLDKLAMRFDIMVMVLYQSIYEGSAI
jgi:hypothetical protein